MLTLTADQARRLTLALQGLAEPPRRRLDSDDLLALIERLGFVQVDSIQTVARAHHMILLARNQTYRPAQLTGLLEGERRLFEHWTDRIAAIIPTRFYPYWTRRFARERARLEQRFVAWFGADHQVELDRVLARIREQGPVMARDLAEGAARPAGGWWDWHPSKAALELLWRSGRLAVARRQGFQKVYDLPERVIPDAARAAGPSDSAFVDWACRSALDRMGFASPGEIARFWGLLTPDEAKAWCEIEAGRGALPIEVDSSDGGGRPMLARADIVGRLADLPDPPGRVRVLSPFDPILRDRQRLQRVFGFDYRIEVFVPAARRRYGYYVFPLLEGDRLVGRIDMKAERDDGVLGVRALWLEPGTRPSRGRHDRLAAELERIRRFVGLDRVRFADGHVKRQG